ncbi:MAG: tetratricopeptide repeat protein [Calditrichaeota bacterium]|nr:MAG: tetratricopeptide repeat protein [Calditrichota bacterium]
MKKIFIILGILCLSAGLAFSSESDSKDDTGDKAIELYNSGVAHMDKAKDIIAVGDSAFAYNYRATSDAKATKEYEKAIVDFKDALKLKPDMKEAYNNLGYCYRKIGKLELSYKNYMRALKFDPNFA